MSTVLLFSYVFFLVWLKHIFVSPLNTKFSYIYSYHFHNKFRNIYLEISDLSVWVSIISVHIGVAILFLMKFEKKFKLQTVFIFTFFFFCIFFLIFLFTRRCCWCSSTSDVWCWIALIFFFIVNAMEQWKNGCLFHHTLMEFTTAMNWNWNQNRNDVENNTTSHRIASHRTAMHIKWLSLYIRCIGKGRWSSIQVLWGYYGCWRRVHANSQ